ncbi:MAG: hypothetical protein E7309_06650 [Butyrivibrio sp.]|jgi:serpin B|nr:hypothetical protein [Butyrivibrio sp.]
MNEHDLLDAIGGIDPKYIKDADKAVSPKSKIVRFQRYYMAAASIFLLVVAGILFKNLYQAPYYESTDETSEITTLSATPEDAEEAAIEEAEGETEQKTATGEAEAETEQETATEEAEVESAESDYAAMIMYDGAIYKDSGEEFIGEILEDNLLKTTSYTDGEPSEDMQQNFNASSKTKFFVWDENTLVVCVDPDEGIWRTFIKQ